MPAVLSELSFIKVSDAARIAAVTPESIRDWIKSAGLPAYRVGGQWRIAPAEFAAWLDSRRYERGR